MRFLAWARQFLVPGLRPGDTVVMDNLSSHKVAGVRAAIEGAGNLSPYSPDFNPNRAKLRQAQNLAAKNPSPHDREAMDGHWFVARAVQQQRMRAVHSPLWLLPVRIIPLRSEQAINRHRTLV